MFSPDIKLDQLCDELSIQEKQLRGLVREKVWVLSFSGGADSVLALTFLVLLHKTSIEDNPHGLLAPDSRHLVIYYLDHQQEFNALERKKRDLVFLLYKEKTKGIQSLRIDWVEKSKPVQKIAQKLKLSFERAGSKIRAKEIRSLSKKLQGGVILGHHLSDWYETLIMRLNRGSSSGKLLPFGFQENTFLERRYYPLFLVFRHEVRNILNRYQIDYWDDPSNEDTSIFRNQIRKEYPIKNYSGLRKTASNMLQEKSVMNTHYRDLKYEVISPMREVRICLDKKFIKMYDSLSKNGQINFLLNILGYLGLRALSNHHRNQLFKKRIMLPPYYVEVENWNNQKYLLFRRGRSSLEEISSKMFQQVNIFLQKIKNKNNYSIIPANKITQKHKIQFAFGRKSVKALLKEKSISSRQRQHLQLVLFKNYQCNEEIIFIPLSVFGLCDIYSEHFISVKTLMDNNNSLQKVF